MLTGPLNAFPWALNGLVESFVSLKRVDKFLKLSTFNDGLYYSDMNEIDHDNSSNFGDEEKFGLQRDVKIFDDKQTPDLATKS